MLDGATVAMVEVRQRSHRSFGGAAASVDHRKQQRLCLAAEHWRLAHPAHSQRPLRFDVICLEGDAAPEWLRAAFDASE
jgi:putative endonuclease